MTSHARAFENRGIRDFFSFEQGVDGFGHGLVVVGLLQEYIEIVVAVGVKQTEAREMSLHTELLRRCGEQKQGGSRHGEGFDELIFRPRFFWRPLEMMGLVHHQKVPARFSRLSGPLGVVGKKIEGADDKLAVQKWIGPVEFQRSAAVFIKNAEGHLEPAEHFHKPLVEQGRGKKHENTAGTTCDVQAMKNKPGLDGFPKPHLVGEEDSGIHTGRHIGRDGNLVRNKIHTPAGKATHGTLPHFAAAEQALHPELEALELIDLSGKETLFRFGKSNVVGKFRLGDIPRPTAIGQQAPGIVYGVHMKALAGVRANGVALLEGDSANRRAAERVLTVFASSRKKNFSAAELALQDDAETKLGLGIADPSLTGNRSGFAHNAESSSQRA